MDSPIQITPRSAAQGGGWVATADHLVGFEARGDTPEAALAALRAVSNTWTAPAAGYTPEPVEMKQMLILRRDVKMPRGKEIAQGAHASMAAVLPNLDDPRVRAWLSGPFAKIAAVVDSEAELMALHERAREAGLIRSIITDSGRTHFSGVPTRTTIAIGPDRVDTIDALTKGLKLR